MSLNPTFYPVISPIPDNVARPFWSVIIPAYKPQYLAEAINSVLHQDPGPDQLELIVIDDASPHDLAAIVAATAKDRARYIRNPINRGTYGTQNAGLALSTGIWTHILNDDDYVLPGLYSSFQQHLQSQPDSTGLASCLYRTIGPDGVNLFTPTPIQENAGIIPDWLNLIGISNPFHPVAVVIRRAVHETVGGYCPTLRYTGDFEFYRRASTRFDWYYVPDQLAIYRDHPASETTAARATADQIRELGAAIDLSEPFMPDHLRGHLAIAAREHQAIYAVSVAWKHLQPPAPNVPAALACLQEGLKLSTAPAVLNRVAKLLTQPEAETFRRMLPGFIAALSPVA